MTARERLAALLGDLLVHPAPEVVAIARELPALAAAFPAELDPDALLASHHAVLGLEVLPYVPVFLSPDGLLRDPAADHVGAWLVRGGEEATADLATVLSLLLLAVRDTSDPRWASVVELALELVLSDGTPPPHPPAGTLPDLDDPVTDLRAIAAALVRPAASGWFPTHRALARVAAAGRVPAGFGPRADRLHGLLLASADAGTLGDLVAGLDAELAGWGEGLAGLSAAPVPPWRARIAETRTWLARVASVSRRGGGTPCV